jgi:Mannosyl-glycoprotein endo-beta-N-acetylglucosaminidase
MTFDDIRPYQQNQNLPQFAKLPTSLKNFLGINAEGQQNTWGKALGWLDPIASGIADKVVANKYFKGTDFYQNANNTAKDAGLRLGVGALTAADIVKDYFTGNIAGIGKDVAGFGQTIAHSMKTNDFTPQGGGIITQAFSKAFPKAYHISGVKGEEDRNYQGDGKLTQMNNTNAPDVSPWMANLFQKPKTGGAQDAFQTSEGADPSLVNAPAVGDAATQQPIDLNKKGSAGFDWSSLLGGGGGGIAGMFGGGGMMREGGLIEGSTHEEGGIALIDTKTGRDTGLRVEGGERIVNDRDYNTVKGYLKKGHYKKALALLEEVEDRRPVGEFADGGTLLDNKNVQDFIAANLGYAKEVEKKYGIPAEVVLAQAGIESGWGKQVVGNNYFGVKGKGVKTTDAQTGKSIEQKAYDSPLESFMDYGKTLSENKAYSKAFENKGDAAKFAQEIAGAGYSEKKEQYADSLKSIIPQIQKVVKPQAQTSEKMETAIPITYQGKELPLSSDITAPKTYKDLMARYNQLKDVLDNPDEVKPKVADASKFGAAKTDALQRIQQEYDVLSKTVNKRSTGLGLDVAINADVAPRDIEGINYNIPKKYRGQDLPEIDITAEKKPLTTAEMLGKVAGKGSDTADIDPFGYQKAPAQETAGYDVVAPTDKVGIEQPPVGQQEQQALSNKQKLGNTLDYAFGTGFDAMRLGAGLMGANKKLPEFKVPQEWTDYMNKARYFSEIGLSPEEKAMANLADKTNYGQAVQDITGASGGNAGAVLGNLSRVNAGRGAYALALAAKDAELKQSNFEKFLPILNEDIGFQKDAFERKYNQDLATKQAGAQLASDALSNIKSRMDYQQSFGPNSPYAQLSKDLESKGKSEAEILKAQADFWSNPANVAKIGNTSPYNHAQLLQ